MDATPSAVTRRPHHHHHPLQDPTNGPPSTVQAISNRFSKLYADHKKLFASSMEPTLGGHLHPHPQPEAHFPAKTQSLPPFLDTLSTTLTKSNSQHERESSNDLEVVNVRIKDELKNPSSKNSSFEGFEVGKVAHLMSGSLESEKVKGFQRDEFKKSSFEGFGVDKAAHLVSKSEKVKGFQKDEIKKLLSKNSSFGGFDVKSASHLMSKSLESEKMKGFQKDEIKKALSKNSSFGGSDVKKASYLMSRSLESEKMKGFQKDGLKKPLTKHSSLKSCDVKNTAHLMSKSLESEKMKGFQNEIKKSSFKGFDVKRASQSMYKSLENEKVKGFQQGFEVIQRPIGNGGRRKSLCSSEVELGDFFSCSGVKVVAVDMPPSMQIHAVDCARKAHDSLEKFTSKTLALTLKKEFDGTYGPAWHCIVGASFGSFVTHSVGGFMYFSMDHKLYVLLFKTTVQRKE